MIPQGYKYTELGIIPEEWEIKHLNEVGIVQTGSTPSTKDESNFGLDYMFVTPADISDEKYITETERKLSYKGFSISRKIPKGSILFTCIGIIGKIAIASDDLTSNQQINAIICNDIHNEYLYYELLGRRNNIKSLAGEQVLPMIKKSDFEKIKIVVPPVEEQRKIAEVLGVWDKAIELQAKIIDKLELRKRALMQRLLSGRQRLPGFSTPWQKVKLEQIGFVYNGLSGKNKDDFEDGNARFITYMNVFANWSIKESMLGVVKINANEHQNKVEYGDVFFTVSSETPDEVGMASVLLQDLPNTYLNSFCFGFRPYDFSALLPIFAAYYFRTYEFRKKMYVIAQGSTRYNISKSEVLDMTICIPSLTEQTAIAEVLSTADQEIKIAKAKLAAYRTQKRGLMQQLLTGKKRVNY